MSEHFSKSIQELQDREAIRDCLATYCRGVDRLDREALLSVYHDDAIDDHGDYVGPASGFVDWAMNYHTSNQIRTQHALTNHLCELDGDVAHTETYWTYRALNRDEPKYICASGRYIDRFERRDGRWAIAVRVCVMDVPDPVMDAAGPFGDGQFQTTVRDSSDPSYKRPLTVDVSRFTG